MKGTDPRILALELSAAQGSVALLSGEQIAARLPCPAEGRGESRLFHSLEELFRRAGWTIADLDLVAAGRGPGSYTGTRLAVTVAHFLCAPHGVRVYYLSSAEAVALAAAAETGVREVMVVGDARRRTAWCGRFLCEPEGLPRLVDGWRLVPLREFPSAVEGGATLVSPDWPRLQRQLLEIGITPPPVRFQRPQAVWLGRTALRRLAAGWPSDPREPLYLHPPVSVVGGPGQ